MARQDDRKGRLGRVIELGLYAVALAVPLLYFGRQYAPFEAWLGQIELRSPIVVGDQESADGAGASGSGTQESAPQQRSQRIYRCINDGEIVLSDRPCGNVVETREIGPGDVNVLPSQAFTGTPAVPEHLDCEELGRTLAALDTRRRESGSSDDVAVERDAVWQRGRAARCW